MNVRLIERTSGNAMMNGSFLFRSFLSSARAVFALPIILVLFITPISPVQACLNLPHEWVPINKDVGSPGEGFFALTDLLLAMKDELLDSQGKDAVASATFRLARLTWGADDHHANAAQIERLRAAGEAIWPTRRWLVGKEPFFLSDNSASIASAIASDGADFQVFLQVREHRRTAKNFLDIITFTFSLIRTVFSEEATGIVKVINRKGDVVLLKEIKVSPTIVTDVLFHPSGNFFTWFAKNDHRPVILDFGELFQGVASSTFQNRPESQRLPDLPTSRPMAPPVSSSEMPVTHE
ncbi:MAG: hypothetical protein WA705_27305 [Candidatus Ozemobacteraceae bacterium]